MKKEHLRIVHISDELLKASSEIRVLRNISWPKNCKESFLLSKATKLPKVSYHEVDVSLPLEIIAKLKKELIPGNPVDDWALKIASKIENSALLLKHRGQKEFFHFSKLLYGEPTDILINGNSSLDLARHFDAMFAQVKHLDLGAPPEACVLATSMAEEMEKVVKKEFGDLAPEIVMDENLASNALAGRQRISIRPGACFTDKDVSQLINHEIYVHVCTSNNGYYQPNLKILGEAHAGTTKTQEGLAIFAEYITNSIDFDRVLRLSDRVLAVQMAIEGADFIEVYKYYLERTGHEDQAFDSTRRVFRGGVMTGGAPFTKDIVYLEGLLAVHSFLRVAMLHGRIDYIDLLFAGKMDISDLPVMNYFKEEGLLQKPTYLPPWMKDKRYLLTYLSYSSFLDDINLEKLSKHYEDMMGEGNLQAAKL